MRASEPYAAGFHRARFTRRILLTLFVVAGLNLEARSQDIHFPQITPVVPKRADGSTLSVYFFANPGTPDGCADGRLFPVSHDPNDAYRIFICDKHLLNSKIEGTEYALLAQGPSGAGEWFHIIVTADDNPDDTYVNASIVVHSEERPNSIKLPVYATVPRDELEGKFPDGTKSVWMGHSNKDEVAISSRLTSMNLSVSDFDGEITPSDFGTVQITAKPGTLHPSDPLELGYALHPYFWSSLGRSLTNFDPNSHDATLTITAHGTPEPGGEKTPHRIQTFLHLEAPIPLVFLCLMLGAVTGVFAANSLADTKSTNNATPRQSVVLGVIFAVGAWILANVSTHAGVAITIKNYTLSTFQPLEMAVLGFVVAGGRSLLSRLTWDNPL